MRRIQAVTRALGGIVLILLCSGPVLNCDCSEGFGGRPDLVVDQTIIQFDQVAVGYPQTKNLEIFSVGRVGLVFDDVDVARGAASPFSVLGRLDATGEIVELPASMGPESSMVIVIQYDPETEDAEDFETLRIVTNDPDECPSEFNQCVVQLNGTGAPPNPELDAVCQQDENCALADTPLCRIIQDAPTLAHPILVSLNFCEVPPGTNRELNVLLSNTGNVPLTMDGFVLDGGIGPTDDFRVLEPAEEDIVIEPGGEQMLSLLYAPQARGADNSGMDVATNDLDLVGTGVPDGTFKVRMLALSAEPDIDVNPENIPFSGVTQGSSDTQTINISNTGDATLEITGIEATGGSVAGEFTVDPTEGFNIPGGSNGSLQVTYSPQDVGADDGSVIISSNDPDEPTAVVTLGGEVRPDLDVTPTAVLEFAGVMPGATDVKDVILTNVGQADLSIGAMTFASNPGEPPVFEMQGLPGGFPGTPIVLAPAESVTFQIQFTDNTLINDEVGQLDIAHDSPSDVLPYPLLLMSTGTPANLPPVALVDPPTQVVHGLQQIQLSAANSFDPDPLPDDVVAWAWAFLYVPVDAQGNQSQAVLDTTDQQTTTFTPDMPGQYLVRLWVFDTYNAQSSPVDAEISVNP